MSKPILHYFFARAKAEVIRYLLVSNGVEYEDTNFNFETWAEVKDSGFYEFKMMPVLEIDGQRLTTSFAIERYLARKFGLYPADNFQSYQVESLVDYRADLFDKIRSFIIVKDDEGLANWFSNGIKASLLILETRLLANHGGEGFFVGESKTWADYSIFQFLHDNLCLEGQEARKAVLVETAPKLFAFVERFLASEPAIQHRIATRPASDL